MSAPDPEGMSMFAKAMMAAVAIVPPIWGARTWIESRLSKKANKDDVEKSLMEVNGELLIHRGYFKDVFTQMRENEGKSEERHRELLMHLIERK